MKESVLFVILLISSQAFGQHSNNCNSIDFEKIPNSLPAEGLPIDSQFFDSFGVTFVLENGDPPILAQVGKPATAFVSSYGDGDDTPKHGQSIGSFFLTDDGNLSGLKSSPLIISFETPVDSIAGCILDIDFDEIFIIQARGELGEVIYQDTIKSGDNGTGDGLATCWEFGVSPCEGEIYSVRLAGIREASGVFGLGIDNFRFCRSEYNIGNSVSIESKNSSCGQNNGSITIVVEGTPSQYEYSLDGVTFQEKNLFANLAPGNYNITIRETSICSSIQKEATIKGTPSPLIENILTSSASCDKENGSLIIEASGGTGSLQYSIDGDTFQTSPTFQDLEAKTYTVYLKDGKNCLVSHTVDVGISSQIMLDQVISNPAECGERNGSLNFKVLGGIGQLKLSLNGGLEQTSTSFSGLEAGEYHVIVTDETGCKVDTLTYVSEMDCRVSIPNAFTPNGDGLNDLFQINAEPDAIITEYSIYNRWGELLYSPIEFSLNSPDYWWDGTYNGSKVGLGVYVYVITIELANGDIIKRNGFITVLK